MGMGVLTISCRGHVCHLPPPARIVDEGLLALANSNSSREEKVSPFSFAQRDEVMVVEGKWE